MTVHVDVIKEEHYAIEIDVPEDKEDELYEKLSCEPCLDDAFDVKCFLEEQGFPFEISSKGNDSRIETWR